MPKMMDGLSKNQGVATAEQAVLEILLDRFSEADRWGENVVRMALEE